MPRPRYTDLTGRRHKWVMVPASRTMTYSIQETPGDTTYLNLLQLAYAASSVNYLKVSACTSAAALTTGVVLEPIGTSTNIDVTIQGKGSGAVNVTGLAAGAALASTTNTTFEVDNGTTHSSLILSASTAGSTGESLTLKTASIAAAQTVTLPDPGGADSAVYLALAQTLTNKTLTTPTIGDFTNSTHDHSNAAGGGSLGSSLAISGTSADTFEVDTNGAYPTITVGSQTAGSGNYSATILPPATMTAAITLTLPNTSSTVAVLGLAQTWTATQTVRAITASAGSYAFDFSGSTGTFLTATGAVTIGGNTTISGAKTFATGSGAVSLNGDTTIADGKELTVGSATGGPSAGYISIFSATAAKGEIRLKQPDDTNNKITTIQANDAAANADITLPNATATLAGLALANAWTAAQTVTVTDAGTTTVTDVLTIAHVGGTPAAGLGTGLVFSVEDAGGLEEQASIDAVLTDVTNGTEDADLAFNINVNGTMTEAMRIVALTANTVAVNIGSDAKAGYLDIHPATTNLGTLRISAADSAGDTVTNIVNASQAGARTYTIPDAGASANFVMSEAAQTIAGATTFSGGLLASAITGSDSSLGIAGLAGSSGNGGAIAVLGGAGDGAGNAGGAIAVSTGAGAAHTTGTGGASGAWAVASGAAGTATTGTGGASGNLTIGSAAGGAATGATSTGGASGAISISSGVGGAANDASACVGGNGGTLSIAAGAGGVSNNAASTGGNGGGVTLYAGNGGASSGGTAGDGGDLVLRAGSGNTAGVISIGATNAASIGIGAAGNLTTVTGGLQTAAGDNIIVNATAGAGYFQVNAGTSGALKFLPTATTTSTVTITTVSCAAGRTYTLPEAGAAANFVMSEGTQTLNGTDTHTGTLDISGATVTYRSILNADISATAAITRSRLAEEALAVYGIPFQAYRNDDGTVMDATGGAGLFNITSGGFGTGTLTIDGEAASGNTKTDTLQFEFVLPPEYMAAGDVKLIVKAKESVGAATVSTTLSAEVYESDGNGAVGSDLYGAFDVTDITTAWQTCTSVVTAAGLVKGDRLIVFVRIVTNDTGAAVGTVAQIGAIEMHCDIKG